MRVKPQKAILTLISEKKYYVSLENSKEMSDAVSATQKPARVLCSKAPPKGIKDIKSFAKKKKSPLGRFI